MDRLPPTRELTERILSAPTRAVVLTGPASAGKTQAVIDLYDRLSSPAAPSRCLILAPSAVAVRHLRRRLLDASPGGTIVSPRVLTFADLSRRILSEAPDAAPAGVLSAFQRRLLLRSIVDRLVDDGTVAGFAKVADTPGLIISLDAAIAELKRAAVEPEQLAPLAADSPAKAALLSVYEQYQLALQASGRCDVEGQAWLARDCLAGLTEAEQSPVVLADVDLLAVDGFTDLTPTQLEMLSLAAAGSRRVLITLPWADDGRSRLWQWTSRTLENIRSGFGDEITHIAVEPATRPALASVWDRVFDYDASPSDPPGGLTLIAAGGIEQEVASAARDIKQLLLDGSPAGTIAVLVRSLDEYGPVVGRIFAECDIPLAPSPTILTDEPIVRFLLAAASLAPQFSYEHVLAVIGSSYFRPHSLGEFDDRTIATARAMIVEGNVVSSSAAYQRAAERFIRLAETSPAGADDADDESLQPAVLLRSADGVRAAADMLTRLFELSGDDLPDLIDALQLSQAACEHDDPQLVARDLRALAALQTALTDLPGDISPRHIREALAAVPCSPARTESLVDVLNVIDARTTRYEHVFLLGLSEGQFPRHLSDSALLTEADRHALIQRGLQVDARTDLTAREMLLFYLAISRCEQTLTLGTLEADAAGRPAGPGAFLSAVGRCVGGLSDLPARTIPQGQYPPPVEMLCSPRDAVNSAVHSLFDRSDTPDQQALAWAAQHATETLTRSAMGILARHRRWQAGQCDEFDGRITDSALLADLKDRYPGKTVFSASQIEQYAACPWRYFARYVLAMTEPADVEEHLQAAERGQIAHGILADVMSALADAHGRPVCLSQIDQRELASTVDAATERIARRFEARRQPAYPALWRIQIDQLRKQVLAYLKNQQNGPWPVEAMHFELAFGMGERRGDEPSSAAGFPEPVELATPAGPIRLRGRIDRVDHVAVGEADGLFVVDYKTGAPPTGPAIKTGRNVQIPLYAAAAEQMLERPCLGGAYHQINRDKAVVCAAIKARSGKVSENAAYEDIRQGVFDAVGRYVSGMAAGEFDLLPTHKCASHCPFRQICHFAEWRASLKHARAAGEGES